MSRPTPTRCCSATRRRCAGWSLDAFFLYRTSKDFIEDQPRVLPASSSWSTTWPRADRKYKAFTVELTDRWPIVEPDRELRAGAASKATSTSTTAAPTAVFNTSSIIEDGPGDSSRTTSATGRSARTGPTFEGVRYLHATTRVTARRLHPAQSGSPWNDKAVDWYNGYRLTSSRRAPTATTPGPTSTSSRRTTCASAADARRTFEARILNLFNAETALTVDDRPFLDPRTRLFDGTQVAGNPASYTRATIINQTVPNAQYALPLTYAPPRRLLLTARSISRNPAKEQGTRDESQGIPKERAQAARPETDPKGTRQGARSAFVFFLCSFL